MVRRDVRIGIVVALWVLGAGGVRGSEIGEVVWKSFEGFPSYTVGAGVGINRGISLGLQLDGLANVNGLLSSVVPAVDKLPRLWLDARWMPLSWSLVRSMTNGGLSDLLGPFFGFSGNHFQVGVGVTLFERQGDDLPFRWIVGQETRTSGSYQVTTTRYYPITGPGVSSVVLMAGLSFEDMGKDWVLTTGSLGPSYRLRSGVRTLFWPGLRFMAANNFKYRNSQTGEVRAFRRFVYQDISVPLTLDFSVIGLAYEVGLMENFMNFKSGIGLMLRRDHPQSGFHAEQLYVPMWISFTFGGNVVPLTEADKAFRNKHGGN